MEVKRSARILKLIFATAHNRSLRSASNDLISIPRSRTTFNDRPFSHSASRIWNSITKTRLFKYIEKITSKKTEIFQIKNCDIFHISAQNIDCRYSLELPQRGGSNEYPQSMFLSRNKKNNVYPCKPQFYYMKVGFKGVKTI